MDGTEGNLRVDNSRPPHWQSDVTVLWAVCDRPTRSPTQRCGTTAASARPSSHQLGDD
jgi:hypothetical protein